MSHPSQQHPHPQQPNHYQPAQPQQPPPTGPPQMAPQQQPPPPQHAPPPGQQLAPQQPHPSMPMQYHPQVHNQQHPPHPMTQTHPYMQYQPHPHPSHYYPHPQQMQPPPPPHQSPYPVGHPGHPSGPPPMAPHPQAHPQAHPQQPGPPPPMYPTHPQSHQPPPPHWQQGPPSHHPQQHMMAPHPSQQHPHAPMPMQYHPQVHNQQHPMTQTHPYMQYQPHPHPSHYYPHPHPQQMQPHPPPHQSPYPVTHGPHPGPPPPMAPHPQQPSPHPQQTHPQQPPGPPMYPSHPQSHQPPPPPQHWQQGPPSHHPQQHMIPPHPSQQHPHPSQPNYYQPPQPQPQQPPPPPPPQTQGPQMPPQPQLPPPVASPHHLPIRPHTPHTPQHMHPQQQQQAPPQPIQQQQPMPRMGHPPPPPPPQIPQLPPPQSSTPASPALSVPEIEKKEITFPKNSVEATKVTTVKKRKFTSKDVTDVEVWRLLMCLKSGLLAESSWAIDVLSILLNDDSTLMYFGLQHMPGLLEAVLEHFKCCLNELFDGIVGDTSLKPVLTEIKPEVENTEPIAIKKENGIINNNNNPNTRNNNISNSKSDSNLSSKAANKKKNNNNTETIDKNNSINIPTRGEQIIMFNSTKNYTSKTRDGRVVKIKNGVTLDLDEPCFELVYKPVGYSHWQEGNGEDTSHIQVFFERDNYIESSRRCSCLSTILRNLSFIPGNDVEMSKHAGLLLILGRLLLLKHDDVVANEADSSPNEWHLLSSLREDTLVIISNISSSLDLSPYNDKINLSLLDGLLHWACCSSSYALDPFPAPSISVSPQRLALESLAKLSIIEGNVDLILATPPWFRIEKLFEVLARLLNINEDQTIREFSLVLLSNLTSADSGIARKVALTGAAIPRLLTFLETSLADPESFATTQDMLRRAAITLKYLSQLVDNHPLFAQYQQRLLNLVMSQKLDPEVMSIIASVIFEISLSD